MVVAEASYKRDTWISIYAIPGLKFHNKPQLDQEARAEDLISIICDHFNISTEEVKSKSRKHKFVIARQLCMWFCKAKTYLSLVQIGNLIGDRDHTTVIHSITQVKNALSLKHDNEIKNAYYELVKHI